MKLSRVRTLFAGLVLGLALSQNSTMFATWPSPEELLSWRKEHVQGLRDMSVEAFSHYLHISRNIAQSSGTGPSSVYADQRHLRSDKQDIVEEPELSKDMACKREMLHRRLLVLALMSRIEPCKELDVLHVGPKYDHEKHEHKKCLQERHEMQDLLALTQSDYTRCKEACKAQEQAKKEQAAQ